MNTMGSAWKHSTIPFNMERELEKYGFLHRVSARCSTPWRDVADVAADAANMGDTEIEAEDTRTIHSSSGIKDDGSKDVPCNIQGQHSKIKQ